MINRVLEQLSLFLAVAPKVREAVTFGMQDQTRFVCINEVHSPVLVANRTLNSELSIGAHGIQSASDASTVASFGELQLLDTLLLVQVWLLVGFKVKIELRLIIHHGDGPVFKLR